MPWFPDFVSAVEVVRRQTREAGHADPVAQYLSALSEGDAGRLETVWPGEVVVFDPRAGEVRGHRQLRHFVRRNMAWLDQHHVWTETVAVTSIEGRAVVELLAHVDGEQGSTWPVAVVAESPSDVSVVFRTYCSQVPVDGRRHIRPPILSVTSNLPDDVIGRYSRALAAGDVETIVECFSPDGYFREPIGTNAMHCGAAQLRALFSAWFAAGDASSGNGSAGISLQPGVVTDDTVRCAVEYSLLRWGSADLPAQAGIAVYERNADGLLAGVRVYDDIEPPV